MSASSSSLVLATVVATVLASGGVAHAEQRAPSVDPARPWTGYVRIPRSQPPTSSVTSRLVYLKRCPAGAGCIIYPGTDDSRTDTSSIASSQRVIGGFSHDITVWNDLMACVRTTFAPFDITITDVDPGNVPHFMNVVGGKGSDLDAQFANAGGVAPFDCGEIPNAITFTFDVYGPNPEALCWTAAQEIAHAFGLEHQFLQKDPMTYLSGDMPKRFRDVDSACGEYEMRACDCGRTSQNSYRMIVALFGPGAPTAPDVMIKRPSDGTEVQPGFRVVVDAQDDVRVERVELWIDGAMTGMTMEPIAGTFEIVAPELAMGPHTLEVRAYDVQGTMGSQTISVTQGPPCTRAAGCEGDDVCVSGLCVPGPAEPGGLGAVCQTDTECLSHRCADAGETYKHCVESCDLANAASCPSEFECVSAGATGVCWPAPDGGCCDAGGAPHSAMMLGLGVGILVLRRRRRR